MLINLVVDDNQVDGGDIIYVSCHINLEFYII